MPNVMGIGPGVSSRQIAEILTPCDFVFLPFHSLFLVVAYSNKRPDVSYRSVHQTTRI